MKITMIVTKSLRQDCGLCYLLLPIFLYIHLGWEIKSCFDCCFPHQIRPQITVQLYLLQDYST